LLRHAPACAEKAGWRAVRPWSAAPAGLTLVIEGAADGDAPDGRAAAAVGDEPGALVLCGRREAGPPHPWTTAEWKGPDMCEYCGCQDVPAIGALTREHDRVIDLIGEVRSAHRDGDMERMAVLTHRIADLLVPHTQVEEQGLFPVLEADFPDQMAELRREHRSVEAVLAESCALASWDPAWAARLLGALDLLRWHILKEQDGVFPAALATLRTADWEALDAAREQVGRRLPHAIAA
jgi:hypothetical protein